MRIPFQEASNYSQWNAQCKWPDSQSISLVSGKLPYEGEYSGDGLGGRNIHPKPGKGIPPSSGGLLEMINYGSDSDLDVKFAIQYLSSELRVFSNYANLKREVQADFQRQIRLMKEGNNSYIDPFLFNIHHSLSLIETYGESLEDIMFLHEKPVSQINEVPFLTIYNDSNNSNDSNTSTLILGRLDVCECLNLLKCPNGSTTLQSGSDKLEDCVKANDEVLSRHSMIPSSLSEANSSKVKNFTDFTELSGNDMIGIGSVVLKPMDVAVFSINMTDLPTNMTYEDHYRLSVYLNCKPCGPRYICNANRKSCKNLSLRDQYDKLNSCLRKYRTPVCVHRDGYSVNASWCKEESIEATEKFKSEYLMFQEPDLYKCLSMPLFCDDSTWTHRSFRRLCQNNEDKQVFDCSLINRWNEYTAWQDKLCCSGIEELDSVSACINNKCSQESFVEALLQKYMSKFETEYGFAPPMSKPEGTFLMDVELQEAVDHPTPFDLFNEWEQYTSSNSSSILRTLNHHQSVKSEPSYIWLKVDGCCQCQPQKMPSFFEKNIRHSGFPDDKHQSIELSITALKSVELTATIELLHGQYFSAFNKYFRDGNRVDLHVHTPSRFATDQSMWMSVLKNDDLTSSSVNLPLNLPIFQYDEAPSILLDRPAIHYYHDTDLSKTSGRTKHEISEHRFEAHSYNDDGRDMKMIQNRISEYKTMTNRRYENQLDHRTIEFTSIAFPFLPFFSNCDGFDSHLSLSRLLDEHPGCTLIEPLNTRPVRQNPILQAFIPLADSCIKEVPMGVGIEGKDGVNLQCQYDEQVTSASENYRWYELAPRTTLFYLTREPISSKSFEAHNKRESKGFQLPNHDGWMIPVIVDDLNGGMRHVLPRAIHLELQYFQIDQYYKRLVEARLYYTEQCTTIKPLHFGGDAEVLRQMAELGIQPCERDINGNLKSYAYNLQVMIYALNWFHLFNRFQFGTSLYLASFTVVGLLSCLIGFLCWLGNRILTKLQNPPKMRTKHLLELIANPSCLGAALAIVPIALCFTGVYWQFVSSDGFWFEKINSSWLRRTIAEKTDIEMITFGRTGTSLAVLGIYLSVLGLSLVIPLQTDESLTERSKVDSLKPSGSDQNQVISKMPILWKRSHVIWYSLCYDFFLLCIWEMSYSASFRENLFVNVLVLKTTHILVEFFLEDVLDESLLCVPFFVTFGMTEFVIVMGSSDFVDFTLVFFIQISSSILQRLYIHPCLKSLKSVSRRWKFLFFQWWTSKRQLTVAQRAEQDARRQSIDEAIETRTEGVEPIIDAMSIFSVHLTARFLCPPLLLLITIFHKHTKIAENYGVNANESIYYTIFSFYMIPWSLLVDVLVVNAQELMHGWRIYDYLIYQKHRFQSREESWILKSTVYDESIPDSIRSIDLMSFSPQYYFLVTVIAAGMVITILSMTILSRLNNYNFLGDPATPIIILTMFLFCQFVRYLVIKVASLKIEYLDWQGLWEVNAVEGTSRHLLLTICCHLDSKLFVPPNTTFACILLCILKELLTMQLRQNWQLVKERKSTWIESVKSLMPSVVRSFVYNSFRKIVHGFYITWWNLSDHKICLQATEVTRILILNT